MDGRQVGWERSAFLIPDEDGRLGTGSDRLGGHEMTHPGNKEWRKNRVRSKNDSFLSGSFNCQR